VYTVSEWEKLPFEQFYSADFVPVYVQRVTPLRKNNCSLKVFKPYQVNYGGFDYAYGTDANYDSAPGVSVWIPDTSNPKESVYFELKYYGVDTSLHIWLETLWVAFSEIEPSSIYTKGFELKVLPHDSSEEITLEEYIAEYGDDPLRFEDMANSLMRYFRSKNSTITQALAFFPEGTKVPTTHWPEMLFTDEHFEEVPVYSANANKPSLKRPNFGYYPPLHELLPTEMPSINGVPLPYSTNGKF